MWALYARSLGKLITNPAVRNAAKEIYSNYGAKFATNFFKSVDKAGLGNLNKDQILNLARSEFTSQTGRLFGDKVTSASNAKKLANLLNKRIDKIEDAARDYAFRQTSAKTINAQLLDFTFASQRASKAREAGSYGFRALVFPLSKGEAFAGGMFRGMTGETLARSLNRVIDVLAGMPRGAVAIPKWRRFLTVLRKEVRYLQSIGEVTSAKKLHQAIKTATKLAGRTTGQPEHLLRYTVAGNITGRATVAISANYVFVDEDTRSRRVQAFKQSVMPYAKERARIYVESYTKDDGTRVKGHYKTIEVAA